MEKGAKVNVKNKDESTVLHTAAFFGHTVTVKLLLKKGAAINAQNVRRETPLDTVAASWSPELEGLYKYIGEALQIPLKMEKIKTARPQIASLLRKKGGKKGSELKAATVTAKK